MHRNSLIWFYQLFLAKTLATNSRYLFKRKNKHVNKIYSWSWEFIFRQNLTIQKYCFQKISINYDKKTWCCPSSWFTYTRLFTRLLNMECFESAVPANFISYAPTFFRWLFWISSRVKSKYYKAMKKLDLYD